MSIREVVPSSDLLSVLIRTLPVSGSDNYDVRMTQWQLMAKDVCMLVDPITTLNSRLGVGNE